MKEYYNMIYKRKTIRKYDDSLCLSSKEIAEIEQHTEKLIPLIPDIKTKFKVVPKDHTTAKRGEFCLLFYSEKKPHYLLNAGYLLEQVDLFLCSQNIGVCWYALAKPKIENEDDLEYVIMLAFGKSRADDFRTSVKEFKRKDKDIIWSGCFDEDIVEAIRLAPSACNTQPWRIRSSDSTITIYRNTKIKSFIPASKLPYYNSIDIGISLCFLETALLYKGLDYTRQLSEENDSDSELIEIATYSLKQ